MKKNMCFAMLLVLFSMKSFAGSTLLWDCTSDSDPDRIDFKIYQVNGAIFAQLDEYYGDGDGYAVDVIQMNKIPNSSADIEAFVQVPLPAAQRLALDPKSTGKTKNAIIRVALAPKGASSITGAASPSGNWLSDDNMTCIRGGQKRTPAPLTKKFHKK